jgi:hypothetical protein
MYVDLSDIALCAWFAGGALALQGRHLERVLVPRYIPSYSLGVRLVLAVPKGFTTHQEQRAGPKRVTLS